MRRRLMGTLGIAAAVMLSMAGGCGKAAAEETVMAETESGVKAEDAAESPSGMEESDVTESLAETEEIRAMESEAPPSEELPPVEMPFELTDFDLLGYDLFGDHFEEICEKAGCPVEELSPSMKGTDSVFGRAMAWSSDEAAASMKRFQFLPEEDYFLEWTTEQSLSANEIRSYRNTLFTETVSTEEMGKRLEISPVSNSPVTLGDSYEDWLLTINFDGIQREGIKTRDGETEEHFGDIVDEYRFMTKWGSARYSEWQTRYKQGDDALYCWLTIYLTDENGEQEEDEADCFILNAIFDSNQKVGSWSARREYENGPKLY